ncbi:YhfX family PLP-dependent enzyme [Streptomyces bathyalis]|uniref:YhfX family PLP-dependent enzyme n=1 Tax=Streptomyces bathyalis TaxID=2710756 RepID=A0A7T1T4P8_9ACTN|nr:alanine racemase [Streptomyces bathyalis]QPP06343.1 YhfX family PLP-dependent enzyme [Streptomyces bathyalis]
MFLDTVLARNPQLADTAASLHRDGAIPPDTYVVDRDAVEGNAALLAERAEELGLSLWFVVKQLGRNPELIAVVARHLPRSAAIDAPEARALHSAGALAGNIGHLVQIPRRALAGMLEWRPEAVTVFDADNARAVSDEAQRQGFVQDVLLRLAGAPGSVYPGQEGGVPPDGVDAFADEAEAMPGIRIAGVTGFPCLLCDPSTGAPLPTGTFTLLREARARLENRGHQGLKLSAPGATSAAALPLLARLGATHGEPGHALTGTTPLHALDPGQPERPGYVYVTEVSHTLADGRPALLGGGFYPRAGIRDALLPRAGLRLPVQEMPAENIDYYRLLDAPPPGAAPVRAGDTAVLAFRTQMFVTRSSIAVVAGLSSGRPRLTGLYDPLGRAL